MLSKPIPWALFFYSALIFSFAIIGFMSLGFAEDPDPGPVEVESSTVAYCIVDVSIEDFDNRSVALKSDSTYYHPRTEETAIIEASPGGWVRAEEAYGSEKVYWNRSVGSDCSIE